MFISPNNADVAWDCPAQNCSYLNEHPGTNYGRCVDIYAPAWQVQVAAGTDECGYREGVLRNGTSYAAPVVAGVVARILERHPTISVPDIWQYISDNSTSVAADLDIGLYTENHKLMYVAPSE